MAAPQVAAAGTVAVGTSGSGGISVPMPSGVTIGDLLVVVVAHDTNGTVTASAGWTQILNASNSTNVRIAVFARVATGSGDTCTVTTSANDFCAQCLRITGHGVAHPNELIGTNLAATNAGSGTNPNPSALSPTAGAADYLAVAACAVDLNAATQQLNSVPSGHTQHSLAKSDSSTSSVALGVASAQTTNVSTVDPPSFAANASRPWITATLAIPPGVPVALAATGTAGANSATTSSFTPPASCTLVAVVHGFDFGTSSITNDPWQLSDTIGDTGGTTWQQAAFARSENDAGFEQATVIWWRKVGSSPSAGTVTAARTTSGFPSTVVAVFVVRSSDVSIGATATAGQIGPVDQLTLSLSPAPGKDHLVISGCGVLFGSTEWTNPTGFHTVAGPLIDGQSAGDYVTVAADGFSATSTLLWDDLGATASSTGAAQAAAVTFAPSSGDAAATATTVDVPVGVPAATVAVGAAAAATPVDAPVDVPAATVATGTTVTAASVDSSTDVPAAAVSASATATPATVDTPAAVPAVAVAASATATATVVDTPVGVPAATAASGTAATPATVDTPVGVPAATVSVSRAATAVVVDAPVDVPAATVAVDVTAAATVVDTPADVPAAAVSASATVTAAQVDTPVDVPAGAVTATGAAAATPVTTPVDVPAGAVTATGTVASTPVDTPVDVPAGVLSGGTTPVAGTVTAPVDVLAPVVVVGSTAQTPSVNATVDVAAAAVTAAAAAVAGTVGASVGVAASVVVADSDAQPACVELQVAVHAAEVVVDATVVGQPSETVVDVAAPVVVAASADTSRLSVTVLERRRHVTIQDRQTAARRRGRHHITVREQR